MSNRPYSVLSDLHKVMSSFASVANLLLQAFPVSIGGGTTNLAAMDRVREEAFGKLVQHFTLQSRTYRVIAVGEALDPSGKPRGHATVEAIVFFKISQAAESGRSLNFSEVSKASDLMRTAFALFRLAILVMLAIKSRVLGQTPPSRQAFRSSTQRHCYRDCPQD